MLGIVVMPGAKYSLLEALDPLQNWGLAAGDSLDAAIPEPSKKKLEKKTQAVPGPRKYVN